MQEEAVRRFQSHGYGPDTAVLMARQMSDIQKKSQMLKDQEGLLAVQDQQQKLNEHKRMLDEQSRYQQFTQRVQSLSPTDLRRNEQLAQLSIQYPDLASSPREEIRKGFGSVMKDAHDISQISTQNQSINAMKMGVPVDKLGGIPQEIVNEQGMVDPEKAKSWSEDYHKQILEREKAEESQKAFVSEEAREKYRRFLEETPENQRKIKAQEAKEKLYNQQVLGQQLKGVPQNMLDIEPTITKGKTKLYYASRDKEGKVVENPDGDIVIYEDKSNPKKPVSQIFSRDTWENLKNVKSQYSGGASRQELTQDKAMEYYKAASGDKEKAREMAKKDGYTF
jgi:hypothetical protein